MGYISGNFNLSMNVLITPLIVASQILGIPNEILKIITVDEMLKSIPEMLKSI